MKKGYSKPLTELELNVLPQASVMAGSDGGSAQGLNDAFDPRGLDNASLVGNSPRMNLQNKASNLWDETE